VRFNPARILATLESHGVRYVLIGGLAANAHGTRRTTRDVDVIVDRSTENLERLAAAARDLEVGSPVLDSRLQELDPLDVADLQRAANVSLDTREGDLDVMNEAKGAPPFEHLEQRAVVVEVLGTRVPVVGLDDLIELKHASGRDVDLRDIADLTDRGGGDTR
jgi:predicted nucleotidyltransferase